MPATVLSVAAGGAALDALVDALSDAQRDDPLAHVTVLAPTARSAIHLRRLVAHRVAARGARHGIANVAFVVLSRLASELGSHALVASGRRPLTRVAIAAACRSLLLEIDGPLQRVATHPSTAAEVADRYEELRHAGPDVLEGLQRLGAGPRQLGRLCVELRRRLEPSTFDDVDVLESATAEVRSGAGVRAMGAVVVYCPMRLRRAELGLLEAIGKQSLLTVVLGTTEVLGADLAVQSALGRLMPDAPFAESRDRAPIVPLFDEIVVAPDPSTEVQEAVRLVGRVLALGVRPERVALVYARPTPYAGLVASALADAGIAWSGPSHRPIGDYSPGRFLHSLVTAARGAVHRRDLVGLIGSAPIRQIDGRAVPLGEWDRCSRLVGATDATVLEWSRRLRELVDSTGQVEEDSGVEQPVEPGDDAGNASTSGAASSGRSARERRTARAAAEFARFLDELQLVLADGRAASDWPALSNWARAALDRYLGSPGEHVERSLEDAEADRLTRELFGELALLGDLEHPVDLGRFARVLEEFLERPGPQHGRLGSSLVVGPIEHAVGLELSLVVVLGCADGDVPPRPTTSPLLSPAERESAGLDPVGATVDPDRETRRVLLALAGASTRIATCPETDGRSGRARVPSRLARDVARRRAPSALGALRAVAEGAVPVSVAELATAALVVSNARGEIASTHFLLGRDPMFADSVRALVAREDMAFGPFDGFVGPGPRSSFELGTPISPTALEDYAHCPFRYFLARQLRVEVIEEPERRVAIDPRDRGLIVHQALERYVRAVIAGDVDERDVDAAALRLAEIVHEVFDRYARFGRTGRSVLSELERRHIVRVVEQERVREAALRLSGRRRPLAVEHAFGFGAVPAAVAELGDRRIAFRGLIDRIDECDDGLEVIDFKTGRSEEFRGLRSDPVDRGRHLQLPVYALAARALAPTSPVRAVYRFVGGDTDDVVFDAAAESVDRFTEVVGVISDGIERGVFPFHPGPPNAADANCRRCDFDALCPSDRQRRWERARSDRPVASYAALVDDPVEDRAGTEQQ